MLGTATCCFRLNMSVSRIVHVEVKVADDEQLL